jgi:hypothetical protein
MDTITYFKLADENVYPVYDGHRPWYDPEKAQVSIRCDDPERYGDDYFMLKASKDGASALYHFQMSNERACRLKRSGIGYEAGT